jgi:hypothetical protein
MAESVMLASTGRAAERFLNRIEQARKSIRGGKGIPLEKLARKLPADSAQQPTQRRRKARR